jgi:hypothetical protein
MECLRNLWETERGLAFIQRHKIVSGGWEAPAAEPTGLYHLSIHAMDCQLTARFNGRIRHSGFFPANTIQFARPDEEVHGTGFGSIKLLTVSFTPEFLAAHLESLFINPDVVELRDVPSTDDVGLARLAQAYEAISARGVSVTQLYFDTIRQAMFDRIVLRHASRPIRPSLSEVLVPAKARTATSCFSSAWSFALRIHDITMRYVTIAPVPLVDHIGDMDCANAHDGHVNMVLIHTLS